jgi:hypothetical protein
MDILEYPPLTPSQRKISAVTFRGYEKREERKCERKRKEEEIKRGN